MHLRWFALGSIDAEMVVYSWVNACMIHGYAVFDIVFGRVLYETNIGEQVPPHSQVPTHQKCHYCSTSMRLQPHILLETPMHTNQPPFPITLSN